MSSNFVSFDKKLKKGRFSYTIKNAISDKDCEKIINTYEDLDQFEASEIVNSGDAPQIRKSKSVFDDKGWIFDLIWPYLKQANHFADWDFNIDSAENYQVAKYEEGDFYAIHIDSLGTNGTKRIDPQRPNLNGKTRKISMTLNLNDPSEYEGGTLRLLGAGTPPSEKGTITFFPSFLPHEVSPIIKGTRYSLVVWFLGAPWQ